MREEMSISIVLSSCSFKEEKWAVIALNISYSHPCQASFLPSMRMLLT